MKILARKKIILRLILIAVVTLLVVTKSSNALPFIFFSGSSPLLVASVSQSHKISNPAAVYCKDLGYAYHIVEDGKGGETDICSLPDGTSCAAWDFLEGKCGQSYSYCARRGLGTRTAVDGKNPFSPDYAVCTDLQGKDVGSVTELDRLAVKVNRCGAKTASPDTASSVSSDVLNPLKPSAQTIASTVPSSWDWRNATYAGTTGDWTTPVKNQGGCGSCWAFAAVGQTEAVLNIAANNPALDKDLSEEYLVSDCYPAGTCCGGWHSGALDFIEDHGIPDENCLPNVSGSCGCSGAEGCSCISSGEHVCSNATCSQRCDDYDSRLSYIDSFGQVGDEHNLPVVQQARIKQALLTYGPLSAALDVAEGDNYWNGDVFMCSHPENVDHAVLIVGYDDPGGYWIAKNSWGSSFQEKGFFKVGYGECLIEKYVYFAHVASTHINRLYLPFVVH